MKELRNEDLEKVVGGQDIYEGQIKFHTGDIVKDREGIRYRILYYDSYDSSYFRDDGPGLGNNWYCAEILFIPDSVKPFTSYNVGENYFVTERNIEYY